MSKTVLITGAAKGIGKAIAFEFAQAGYSVGIHYNTSYQDALHLKEQLKSFGAEAEVFCGDISIADNCEVIANAFLEKFKKIDVLINNAGTAKIAPINDLSTSDWNKIINTNLSSAFYLTKALLPCFIKYKSGSIINISSIWGVNGASCEVAYSASKAGLIGFTKALAKELAPSRIRVNCISPGVINTDMNKELSPEIISELIEATPLSRIGEPEDIAKAALYLASEDSSFITGQNIIVDGGYI